MFFEDSAESKRTADLRDLEVSLEEVRRNLRHSGDFRLKLLIDMLSIEIKREANDVTQPDKSSE